MDLIVFFNGRPGPPVRIQIVRNNFNIFTTAAGRGPAIVTNFINQTEQPLNTRSASLMHNQVATIWGTGGGPINAPDDLAPPVGNLPFDFDILVGGVLQPKKLYHGRSSCCSALDQVIFELDPNTPTGCAVPIQVRAGGPAAPGPTRPQLPLPPAEALVLIRRIPFPLCRRPEAALAWSR